MYKAKTKRNQVKQNRESNRKCTQRRNEDNEHQDKIIDLSSLIKFQALMQSLKIPIINSDTRNRVQFRAKVPP